MSDGLRDYDLRYKLDRLDRGGYGGELKAEVQAEVLAMIRERGGYYDHSGIRYVARGDGLYRTLPT